VLESTNNKKNRNSALKKKSSFIGNAARFVQEEAVDFVADEAVDFVEELLSNLFF
jgi:hypothetical protein